jgi:hypothetical protein
MGLTLDILEGQLRPGKITTASDHVAPVHRSFAAVDALDLDCQFVAREHLRALCRCRYFAAPRRGREGTETFCASHHAAS